MFRTSRAAALAGKVYKVIRNLESEYVRMRFSDPCRLVTPWGKKRDSGMVSTRGRPAASHAPFWPVFLRKFLWGIGILVAVVFVVLAGAGTFLTYHIVTAHNEVEDVTPASYLLNSYENVGFADSDGGKHQGWLLRGLQSAPTIILCPGYNSNRSELLSLGTVLQANHFNVYLFNFDSPGSKDRVSDLGIREATQVMAAISTVTKLPGVNPNRVGLYGSTLGGYAALVASEQTPAVEALVIDDGYEQPEQLFSAQLRQLLGSSKQAFGLLAPVEFGMLMLRSHRPDAQPGLAKLAGRPKLFLTADDFPVLRAATQKLYDDSPQPKQLAILSYTRTSSSSGPEKKAYEDQVLNFFLQHLPLRAN